MPFTLLYILASVSALFAHASLLCHISSEKVFVFYL